MLTAALASGQLVAVVGENGSGKTTLLKLLAGILRPQAGEVQWPDGEHKHKGNKIGYLAQQENPSWALQVEDMVAIGLPAELTGAAAEERIHAALLATDSLQFRGRNVAELSSGELQRVLFARVVAAEPQIIFGRRAHGCTRFTSSRKYAELAATTGATRAQCGCGDA